jgi:signal transduction histidine kinase
MEHDYMTSEILQDHTIDQKLINTPGTGINPLLQSLFRPHPSLKDELSQRRSTLLATMSFAVFIIGVVFFVYQAIAFPDILNDVDTWVIVGGILAILGVYLVNRAGHVDFGAGLFIATLTGVFVFVPFIPGAVVNLLYFNVLPIVLTAVFFSLWVTIRLTAGITVTIIVLGAFAPQDNTLWVIQYLILTGSVIFIFIKHLQYQEGLRAKELQHINEQLKVSEENLEQRVHQRTRDLQVASDVSLQITTVLDRSQLLADVAERTANAFGLYHVSIFLYDGQQRALRLQQGVGSVGKQMLGKQFQMSDAGLVPEAARTLQAALSNDVLESQHHLVNPLLPETRSELAIPMIYQRKLIGVLDLQSEQAARFTNEDIRILKTLADQIAIAMRNSQLFEETTAALEQAERANSVKSAFLASMSHELRTPLNAIINFTKFVAKGSMGPVNEEQSETLNEVIDSARHLLNLINDVLDMSKIEAGSLKLFIESNVDLNTILKTLQATGKTLLTDKPVELLADIEDGLPTIMGDRQRILQILLNIISNACKFTEEGSIQIRACQSGDDVLFSIADSGSGIAPEDQPLVFEAFKQTETGLRQGGGTGLGMPISRSLTEAHGGRLWLESEPGKGTTFFVSLPIQSQMLTPSIVA